jgi:hypothetical protein
MVIGWLHDEGTITGGAEMSLKRFLDGAPEWVTGLVKCTPGKRPPETIDAFVIHNCINYGPQWIEVLETRPFVKRVHDPWMHGSAVLRRWILDNAKLIIFNSPRQRSIFHFPFMTEWVASPQPVDIEKFRTIALASPYLEDRSGTMWLGRIEPGKGIYMVADWAMREGIDVDMYGPYFLREQRLLDWMKTPYTRWLGPVESEDVPALMARYKQMVHFPVKRDACDRVAVEAWASGLELVLRNEDAEYFYPWVENADFTTAVEQHWGYVYEAINS